MDNDTRFVIKVVAVIVTFVVLWSFIEWLTGPAMGKQPVTRDLDMRLSAHDGKVYGFIDESGTLPIGVWQSQWSETPRGGRSRLRVFHTHTNGGENLLFSFRQSQPMRGGDGTEVEAIEFPGSVWVPLSGKGRLWELDGGDYRVVVKVFLAGSGGQ